MTQTPIYKKLFSHGGNRSGATYEPKHEDRDDDGIPVDPGYQMGEIPQLMLRKYGGKTGVTDSGRNRSKKEAPHV